MTTLATLGSRGLVMTKRSLWPERELRQLPFQPAPLKDHVALDAETFRRSCRSIGVRPGRVRLKTSPYIDFYVCDLSDAWIPPMALYLMSRAGAEATGRAGMSVDAARRNLEAKSTELNRCETRLAQLRRAIETGEGIDCEYGIDFDRTLNHPDIERIEFDGRGYIVVHTGHISFEHERRTYHVGRFIITINPNGSAHSVRMRNKDRRQRMTRSTPGNYDHPHVRDEIPCLGNIAPDLQRALQRRQFGAAIALCVRFLRSYCDEDHNPYGYTYRDWAGWEPEERRDP